MKTCLPWGKRKTAQDSIPFEKMYDDGICYIGDGRYSATWAFDDIDYSNLEDSEQKEIIERFCQFLNSFDETMHLQIHIMTIPLSREHLNLAIDAGAGAPEARTQCVREYNEFLKRTL